MSSSRETGNRPWAANSRSARGAKPLADAGEQLRDVRDAARGFHHGVGRGRGVSRQAKTRHLARAPGRAAHVTHVRDAGRPGIAEHEVDLLPARPPRPMRRRRRAGAKRPSPRRSAPPPSTGPAAPSPPGWSAESSGSERLCRLGRKRRRGGRRGGLRLGDGLRNHGAAVIGGGRLAPLHQEDAGDAGGHQGEPDHPGTDAPLLHQEGWVDRERLARLGEMAPCGVERPAATPRGKRRRGPGTGGRTSARRPGSASERTRRPRSRQASGPRSSCGRRSPRAAGRRSRGRA